MSYCRWSSDDFQCDLYVYESVYDNWTIHVAGRRRAYHKPLPPKVPFPVGDISVEDAGFQAWYGRHAAIMDWPHDMVDIGLSRDGETYYLTSPGEAADKIADLAAEGYRVPDGVIEALREEQRDLDRAQ